MLMSNRNRRKNGIQTHSDRDRDTVTVVNELLAKQVSFIVVIYEYCVYHRCSYVVFVYLGGLIDMKVP